VPLQHKPQIHPDIDHRKAVLLLRWLLIILASYLTLFTYLGTGTFPVVFAIALAFTASNVGLMVVPRQRFTSVALQRALEVVDILFVAATLYFLRGSETHLYLAFVGVFILAVVWRDLRLVCFSIFTVSVLFGTFNYFRLFGFELEVNIEHFLTLALFFAIFYVVLSKLLTDDARLAHAMFEENRTAQVMVEITRALSASLKSDNVLSAIAYKLREVLDAEECSIIRVDPKTDRAQIIVRSSNAGDSQIDIDLEKYPEIKDAYHTRKLLFLRDAEPCGLIVVPMVAQDAVLGLIYIRCAKLRMALTETSVRFFEVMASTAANAFRNAQLFEEVEHRARTDFLTGLPNHRFFQTTLSLEFGRATRHNHALSLLIVDLDFLKEVNDKFGHPSGDIVIRTVAETIRSTCRDIDFAARYGGEEFTVILPETALNAAVQVADRIRESISALRFVGAGTITASIGVSNYPVNAVSKEDLIRVADQALYVAKNGGRDRVAYFNYQMITREHETVG
jgi:diguanylate cyclase (GGDEF)-like protein